ncbi:hypothetical protein CK203_087210 [Vitis vinifera]|uniref:Uncharacterized protein n=1 Tax=Vitis vinifera TaxID=29760 RepID=A0A438BRX7_VITVI|nr:hypothetical protein CK203_087210 [Vitis vinifera]
MAFGRQLLQVCENFAHPPLAVRMVCEVRTPPSELSRFPFSLYYFLFLGSQTTSEDVFSEDERLNFWFLGVMEASGANTFPRVVPYISVGHGSHPIQGDLWRFIPSKQGASIWDAPSRCAVVVQHFSFSAFSAEARSHPGRVIQDI